MIALDQSQTRLLRRETQFRVFAIAAITTSAALLRAFDPVNAHPWFPLSCGAMTGLPCIFCGTTRALHYLLNGDFSRALYFNWIAFPVAALALVVGLIAGCEVILRQRLVGLRTVRVTPRAIALALVVLAVAWSFQVWLAVSQQKTELLNPRGPLYALFVR